MVPPTFYDTSPYAYAPDQTFSTQDETNELHNVELEVAAAVSIMKLPEDGDSESGDSDFEYDWLEHRPQEK